MDLFELLQRGYFPKELPPSFNTYQFALKGAKFLQKLISAQTTPGSFVIRRPGEIGQDYNQRVNEFKKKYGNMASAPAHYSMEKSDVSRRMLHIPNPLNYLKLADLIVKNKTAILGNIPVSAYSISKASYESDISKRCIVAKSFPLAVYKREKLKAGMAKKYEVKIDVANFYPTVYTHSITWALLGRPKAKEIWGLNKAQRSVYTPAADVQLYEMGDLIDTATRNCNECQTHGILVGPDVSFLIGELIMSRIDVNLAAKFPELKGFRYYDDYTFYVDTVEEADEIYQTLQAELHLFGLEINEAKFEKKKAPSPIEEDHVREINPVRIDKDAVKQGESILHLFDIMWKCAELRPDKMLTIFKYGLRLLINRCVKLDSSNRSLYEPMLYKTAVLKPTVLSYICEILDLSSELPNKNLLADTVAAIFKAHIPYAHDNEVAWALWMCKKYDIKIEDSMVCQIFGMGSTVCTIILLDILNTSQKAMLCEPKVQACISDIRTSLTEKSLYTEDWLLLYEASEQGWIDNSVAITGDFFFNMLHDEKVKFYDSNVSANYTSYDYIETLPYDYYPPTKKADAKAMTGKILDKVRKTAFDKFYDEDAVYSITEDELKDAIDSEIAKHNFEEKLLSIILNPVFRGEDVDEKKLVNQFLSLIDLCLEY